MGRLSFLKTNLGEASVPLCDLTTASFWNDVFLIAFFLKIGQAKDVKNFKGPLRTF